MFGKLCFVVVEADEHSYTNDGNDKLDSNDNNVVHNEIYLNNE